MKVLAIKDIKDEMKKKKKCYSIYKWYHVKWKTGLSL